ncbi:type I methionyl aminopeptidase [Zooshikella marina]|uniref:type I methionyl aminopeptidase n=1 Tax=Zooshikella ganghwensis TaxID=202772 RepID=UPI001BAEB33D|nr:type I methionyl aminopeptidase [Zooshikella ganghwensis]MBU2705776.1 type I methionyl aminopeptidase [Zooshikella ganghwensis]
MHYRELESFAVKNYCQDLPLRMNVTIKTPEEIEKMRIAGRMAAEVLEMIEPYVVAGVTTGELDRICHDYIVNTLDAIPAPLNYRGFPKSICTSVNHVVCHGIPSDKKTLKNGDIINIDVTVIKEGYHGDTSKMFFIGNPPEHARRLCQVTQECLYKGIAAVRPGAFLGDIGFVIAQHAHANHYSVVEEYCGHGIGKEFHEDPQVLHYGKAGTGLKLQEGMTFTIEPMINAGKKFTKLNKNDHWTVTTKDGRLSAQWEHTILVTATGAEIFTQRKEENIL